MTVLVLARHSERGLNPETPRLVMCATHISMHLDGEVHVMLAGRHSRTAVDEAAQIQGVSRVLCCPRPLDEQDPQRDHAQRALALLSGYSHVLCPNDADGPLWARHLANALAFEAVSGVVEVVRDDTFVRLQSNGYPEQIRCPVEQLAVLTVDAACFDEAPPLGCASIEYCDTATGRLGMPAPIEPRLAPAAQADPLNDLPVGCMP